MSMLILKKLRENQFVIVPYKRPKWDSLHYASASVETVACDSIEEEVFERLGAELRDDQQGVVPESRKNHGLTAIEEKKALSDATAIFVGAKRVVGGFVADIIRFTPCLIKQRRFHRVVDRDPALKH